MTEASRDLDALVAEKVMGWRTSVEQRHLRYTDPTNTIRTPVVPYFSTDIGAAWLVVEWMVAQGWSVDVQNRYAPTWACHVHKPAYQPEPRNFFTHTRSAAHAICLAALEAVGALPYDSSRVPAMRPPARSTLGEPEAAPVTPETDVAPEETGMKAFVGQWPIKMSDAEFLKRTEDE